MHFTATIYLNGYYLRNATKEFHTALVLHETLHAIFTYRWLQYKAWLHYNIGNIDSFYIKQHFPIHWAYIMQRDQLTEEQDHQIMASEYRDKFETELRKYFNPNAPIAIRDSVIRALAYSGLTETSTWKKLPKFGMDTCKYIKMEWAAANSQTSYDILSGCGYTNLHYADSLKLRPGCH